MKRILKWLGVGAGSLASLGLGAYGVVHVMTNQRIALTHEVEPVALEIPADAESIARGEHMVRTIAKCQACHGARFAGDVFIEDPMIGRLSAPNITPAGVVRGYTDRDWVRAIRHGVKRDGRSVIMMPSYEFAHMSDADLAASIAYLRTLEPQPGEPAALRLGPLARVLIAARLFPLLAAEDIDHAASRSSAPATAPTAEYGRYLASIGCTGCHGPTLQGARPPGTGPDITARGGLAGWTEEDFRRVMRHGLRPDGSLVDSEMPWPITAGMTDVELAAVWAYLKEIGSSAIASRH